ncbi:hypothetical protein H8959_002518 [Pygathrix nigripes]
MKGNGYGDEEKWTSASRDRLSQPPVGFHLSIVTIAQESRLTSGSDSSLSDGLPVHLANIADELTQKKKMFKKKKKKSLQTRKQRNEQYQKKNLMWKLTEDTSERTGFASTLQNHPAFFKNSENSSFLPMRSENPRLNENKKPGFTVSCSPKRTINSSQEPAPGMKPNWPRSRYPATKRDCAAMAAYPSLHIYTYP